MRGMQRPLRRWCAPCTRKGRRRWQRLARLRHPPGAAKAVRRVPRRCMALVACRGTSRHGSGWYGQRRRSACAVQCPDPVAAVHRPPLAEFVGWGKGAAVLGVPAPYFSPGVLAGCYPIGAPGRVPGWVTVGAAADPLLVCTRCRLHGSVTTTASTGLLLPPYPTPPSVQSALPSSTRWAHGMSPRGTRLLPAVHGRHVGWGRWGAAPGERIVMGNGTLRNVPPVERQNEQ